VFPATIGATVANAVFFTASSAGFTCCAEQLFRHRDLPFQAGTRRRAPGVGRGKGARKRRGHTGRATAPTVIGAKTCGLSPSADPALRASRSWWEGSPCTGPESLVVRGWAPGRPPARASWRSGGATGRRGELLGPKNPLMRPRQRCHSPFIVVPPASAASRSLLPVAARITSSCRARVATPTRPRLPVVALSRRLSRKTGS
jgi:hypothetical protein